MKDRKILRKIKRIAAACAAAVVALTTLSVLPGGVFTARAEATSIMTEEPPTGSDDYYEIYNAGQLYWFAAKVN
ncbi:MAG: hypothetical protein LUC50_09305, partial [Ruminococcus sp.]|nr:hypothetical protein [Ruminococcus sp.]